MSSADEIRYSDLPVAEQVALEVGPIVRARAAEAAEQIRNRVDADET